jgi:6,7-dimethyl-8-ribityllumazine synthase
MNRDIDESSENVLSEWPRTGPDEESEEGRPWGVTGAEPEDEHEPAPEPAPTEAWSVAVPEEAEEAEEAEKADAEEADADEVEEAAEPESFEVEPDEVSSGAIAVAPSLEHAAGDLDIPEGYAVLEGVPDGGRRAVGVVVARFNGKVTSQLLERALSELETAGVRPDATTVMVVPGAFELPVAATALAKTRRFACIVALGCVIRGDTPHFDYVASEAASGLQLAALETGVPVSFGVLTLDRVEQAEARIEKGA